MIKILAVGKLKDPNLKKSFDEYRQRLERFTRIEVTVLNSVDRIPFHIKDGNVVVVLDELGENLSSLSLSEFIKENSLTKDIIFIVGGPEGLKNVVIKDPDIRLSLSKMTLTSQMARLVLIEQIYRAFTLIKGLKYHK
jgi:23S rRNA (pseudouridine1915-N3)-methyltransferase